MYNHTHTCTCIHHNKNYLDTYTVYTPNVHSIYVRKLAAMLTVGARPYFPSCIAPVGTVRYILIYGFARPMCCTL